MVLDALRKPELGTICITVKDRGHCWLAQAGERDGVCATGKTPQLALMELANTMNRFLIERGTGDLIDELRRRSPAAIRKEVTSGS